MSAGKFLASGPGSRNNEHSTEPKTFKFGRHAVQSPSPATALGEISDERSREALIAGLHNPDALESTRFMCAWGLGEFTTANPGNCYKLATEALWEATADYPESLAEECGLTLAEMGWEPE